MYDATSIYVNILNCPLVYLCPLTMNHIWVNNLGYLGLQTQPQKTVFFIVAAFE